MRPTLESPRDRRPGTHVAVLQKSPPSRPLYRIARGQAFRCRQGDAHACSLLTQPTGQPSQPDRLPRPRVRRWIFLRQLCALPITPLRVGLAPTSRWPPEAGIDNPRARGADQKAQTEWGFGNTISGSLLAGVRALVCGKGIFRPRGAADRTQRLCQVRRRGVGFGCLVSSRSVERTNVMVGTIECILLVPRWWGVQMGNPTHTNPCPQGRIVSTTRAKPAVANAVPMA